MNATELIAAKLEERPISMITCYDAWSAKLIEQSPIDCVLVGDSVAMVVHGYDSTLPATPEMIATHVAAVRRGLGSASKKLLVGDMPFGSYRKGIKDAMECVESFMRAGAGCVKLEGVWGHEEVIENIVGSGVPLQGHIGLTPQSVHGLGGYKVQGRQEEQRKDLLGQAKRLQELGACSIVLECVPETLAKEITQSLSIPTIGIGAGIYCDGQVLVLQDMLGLGGEFRPKFLKAYAQANETFLEAFGQYDREVKARLFPTDKETYK